MSLDRAGVTVLVTGSGEFVVAYLATTALLPSCELVINTFSLHQMNGRGLGKTDLKPGEIRSVKLEIIYNRDRSQVTDSDQK